tara:strand:+ start:43 stop:588 length:546 start_codon:yes stop_codon:yes gene_type:complete
MIRLKQILTELSDDELSVLLRKIKNNEFRFLAQGDNGRVYEINDEDKLFKITTESEEYEVASVIVGRKGEFSAFIPIYYVNEKKLLYIMSKADQLSNLDRQNIEQFLQGYKIYARNQGGEISIFDYLSDDGARDLDQEVVSFLRSLQTEIAKMGIRELDLNLDFKTDNVMRWQGRLVLIDW